MRKSLVKLYLKKIATSYNSECLGILGNFLDSLGHPLFFRLLSNAFSDFGSLGRKNKKKSKNKIGKLSGARRPGTSA